MSGIPVWLIILGAIPPAIYGLRLVWRAFRNGAHLFVQLEKAAKVILYELVPNEGLSIKDKATRAVELGEQNQAALESHLIDHHNAGRSTPEGTPQGF